MVHGLGVLSREIWQEIVGLLPDQLVEPTRPMQTAKCHVFFFLFSPLLLILKYDSSCQRLGSHGTTAAIQAFPFVTATNGASAGGFDSVRVWACVIVGSYSSRNQENSLKNGGAIQRLVLVFIFASYAVFSF